MNDLEELQGRLAEALENAARRRAEERSARVVEMHDRDSRRTAFEKVAGGWLQELVVPRLRVLTQAFPQAGEVECGPDGCFARVKFSRTDEYPVSASLTVSIIPDVLYEHARLRVEPILIPMFAGHPQVVSFDCDTPRGAGPAPARLLDDAILAFVESYLRVRDSGSPYRRDALVTDPVCGMSIQRGDAAEFLEHEGKRYFFCVPSCAERFRAEPERYLQGLPGRPERR